MAGARPSARKAERAAAPTRAFTHAWHQAIIEDFADAVAKGRDPVCTGREALLVHGVIEALVRSSAEGRTVHLSDVG